MRVAFFSVLFAFGASTAAGASERYEVLQACWALASKYQIASKLFIETSTPAVRQRIATLPSIGVSMEEDEEFFRIVAGPEASVVLTDAATIKETVFGAKQLGHVSQDVAACLSTDGSNDCRPQFSALKGISNALKKSCELDYKNWDAS